MKLIMERIMERNKKGIDGFSIVLLVLAAILALFIAGGTIWAFATGRVHLPANGRSLFARDARNPGQESVIAADAKGNTAVFGEIGPLRAITADKVPVTVLVTPFFPYPAADIPFREELVQKTRTLRTTILLWFRSHTIAEITKLGEDGVKKELIKGINSNLVLGEITILYFDEYMVF